MTQALEQKALQSALKLRSYDLAKFSHIVPVEHTVNGERFAGLNFHSFCGF